MREGKAPVIRRADYRPPPFWIRTVELCFDLDPAKTLVINKMQMRATPTCRAAGRCAWTARS